MAKNTIDEYFLSDEFQEMLKKYEDGCKSGRPPYLDADDIADIVEYYWDSRDYDNTEKALKYCIHLHPDEQRTLALQVRMALFGHHDIEEAKRLLKRLSPYDTDNETAFTKAEVALADNSPQIATEVLNRQLERITDPAERDDFLLDCADIFELYDRYDYALQWILKGKDLYKRSEEAKEMMARTLVKNGEYEKGKSLFNELIDNDPYNSDYWYSLSMAQMWNGEIEDSISSAEYAIAIDPDDDESLKLKADALYELGNYEEALKYYHKCRELNPESESAAIMEATMLTMLNKYDEALQVLLTAEENAGDNERKLAKIYPETATVYIHLNKKKKAREYLALFKNTADGQTPSGLVTIGHILLSLGDVEEAASNFVDALNDSNMDEDLQMQVAASLMDNGYYQQAYTLLKEMLHDEEAGKEQKKGYAALAVCCDELGLEDEFLKYLKIAAQQHPHETKSVLSEYFPEGMDPKDYYNYMYKKIKDKKK